MSPFFLLLFTLAHFGDTLGDGGSQGWNVVALLVGFEDAERHVADVVAVEFLFLGLELLLVHVVAAGGICLYDNLVVLALPVVFPVVHLHDKVFRGYVAVFTDAEHLGILVFVVHLLTTFQLFVLSLRLIGIQLHLAPVERHVAHTIGIGDVAHRTLRIADAQSAVAKVFQRYGIVTFHCWKGNLKPILY